MMEFVALWAGNPCPLRAESTELSMAGLEARATIWPWGIPTGTPHTSSDQPEAEDPSLFLCGDDFHGVLVPHLPFSLSQGTSIKAIPSYFTNFSYFSLCNGFVKPSAGMSSPLRYWISNAPSLVYLISHLYLISIYLVRTAFWGFNT